MKDFICPPKPKEPEPPDPLLAKGWSALEKRQNAVAVSLSDKSKNANIVRAIRLSTDYDIISKLAHGLASCWGRVTSLFVEASAKREPVGRKELKDLIAELRLVGIHPKAVDSLFQCFDKESFATDGANTSSCNLDELTFAVRSKLKPVSGSDGVWWGAVGERWRAAPACDGGADNGGRWG